MTPRSIRRAAERKASKIARKAAVNRENAQFSTGPVTAAGKAVSSGNALTSGLTGRIVLLPTDDAAHYQTHVQRFASHWEPVGPEEQALVQSLADTNWRLIRVPGLEMAIYAQGRIEFAEEFAEEFANEDPDVRCALIEAQIYLAYEKQLRNLHLQEARLVRRRDKETAELHRLQQERRAAAAPDRKRKPSAVNALPETGFEFATPGITRRQPLAEASPGPHDQANAA